MSRTATTAPRATPERNAVEPPWPHQIETALFCTKLKECLDLSDPGTGKTRAHLMAYANRRKAGAGRCLVVCPKSLMVPAWGSDSDKFTPHLSYAIADASNRFSAFEFGTDIVITNTDGVTALAKRPTVLKGFTDLIIDEVTYFKRGTSQRSKAMYKLSRIFRHKYALSGTPNPHSVTELWHPSLIVDGGMRLGSSFYRFRNSVQEAEQVGPMPNMVKWHDKPEALEAVYGLLSDITIRHAFEDVMTQVPANHVSTYEFELAPALLKRYHKLEDESVLALQDGTITAVHAASLRSKLLQCASGAVYTEDGKYSVLDRARYELILELINQYHHSVVFFNWRHQRDQLVDALENQGTTFAVIDGDTASGLRDSLVAEYQSGAYKTILLHPRTGAHGLTLTRGEACILASPIYEADLLKQAIHRIYRGSQDKATNTILVRARGTVEDLVYERLDQNVRNMGDFLALASMSRQRRMLCER